MRFTNADLLPGHGNRAYHLDIPPSVLADRVILCGDPGRVESVAAALLHDCGPASRHRGLTTITGESVHGQRITVTTTGMGTGSVEIVMRELSALRRVNLATGELMPQIPPPLSVIRLGTSGSLQRDVPVGAAIITDWAVGLDNSGLFYEVAAPDGAADLEDRLAKQLNAAMLANSRFRGGLQPYVARASAVTVERLRRAATALDYPFAVGTTVTAPGLFAAQGRPVEGLTNSVPDIDAILANLTGADGQRFLNFEMETAIICHLASGWGWLAGAVCVAIANRRDESANTTDYNAAVLRAAEIAVNSFALDSASGS